MTKKKKKQLYTILSLCLVLAALGIGYFFAARYEKSKEEAESDNEIELYSMEEEDIYKIHYTNQAADITLVKEDDVWKLEEDRDFPVDQSIVKTMVGDTASVSAKRLVTEDCDDLAEYELEEPVLTLTLEDKDGNERKIAYGLETAAAGGCYAYTEDSRVVYVVPSNVTSDFEYTRNQLMEVPDVPDIDEENLTAYSVKDAAGKSWRASEEDLEDISYSLSDISITEGVSYQASEKEREKYGLAKPAYTITVKYEVTQAEERSADSTSETDSTDEVSETKKRSKETLKIMTGAKDDTEENYYVSIDGEEGIYLMPADVIDELVSELK